MPAKRYGWIPRFEPVDNNPYLADFYADLPRWSFTLQVYFLNKRFKEVVESSKSSDTIIQDRTIFEDARIFAPNLHGQGMMSDRDFQNYTDLFDLMIYLRSELPHLVENIQKRGRDYEQTIPLEYLSNLNERYEDFIFNKYKGRKLVVEVDELDFLHNPKDFAGILDRVDSQLFGLFSPHEL